MAINKEAVAKHLSKVNASQQSIESTSKLISFYRKEAKAVAWLWHQEFSRAPVDRKLALIYLANHVLQETRKRGMEFIDEFYAVLPGAVKVMMSERDEKMKRGVLRVVEIWEERHVFGNNRIKAFRDAVGGALPSPSKQQQQQQQQQQPNPEQRARSGGSGGAGLSGDERRKLSLVGPLADALLHVEHSAASTSEWSDRSIALLNKGVVDNGQLPELNAAVEAFSGQLAALSEEEAARRKAIAALRSLLSQQEDAVTRNAKQVQHIDSLKGRVQGRIIALSQVAPQLAPPHMDMPGYSHHHQMPPTQATLPVQLPTAPPTVRYDPRHATSQPQQHTSFPAVLPLGGPAASSAPPSISRSGPPSSTALPPMAGYSPNTSGILDELSGLAGLDYQPDSFVDLASPGSNGPGDGAMSGYPSVSHASAAARPGPPADTAATASGGAGGGAVVEEAAGDVAAQLASNAESAMLLAKALAQLPEELRQGFAGSLAEGLGAGPGAAAAAGGSAGSGELSYRQLGMDAFDGGGGGTGGDALLGGISGGDGSLLFDDEDPDGDEYDPEFPD